MNNILMNTTKDSKPQISIDLLKFIVKKLKDKGFKQLSHHDLAVALTTVGFSEVCKQFGATWSHQDQKQAQKILTNSEYDLNWYGKINNGRFNNFLALCSRGDVQKIKQLMSTLNEESKKQLRTTVDNFKRNAIHLAVKQGYDILIDYLIQEKFPVNGRDRQLKTPIHYCKDQLTCQVLLNNEVNLGAKDNKLCTPSHYLSSGADYKCLQMILKQRNTVNQKDATGKTPLFYSVYNTSQQLVNIIRVLIENGANVNEQDIFGKTPLHYAAQMGKSRCIPILLRNGASIDLRDRQGKSPIDLAQNQLKVKKIMLAYSTNKGIIDLEEQKEKRGQFKQIIQKNSQKQQNNSRLKQNLGKSSIKESNKTSKSKKPQENQLLTRQVNQVSTWVRQKFFVLMKKLQQSGVKAMWHLKKPYVYTGSWAEDIESLQDLYQTFLNINGPEAAMRAFNILCPYQKQLPNVLNKSQEAFQSFFGESWFSNDPVQKLRNMHSSSKVRSQLQQKFKQTQSLKSQLLGYKSQIQDLQSKIMNYRQQISHYKLVEQDLRKQKNKNTQQYTQILKLMSQNQQLKTQLNDITGNEEKTKILSNLVSQLRSKNQDLLKQIQTIKTIQAASRRKCGQIFIKGLNLTQNSSQQYLPNQQNLYDDDAIISLYNLLKNNPPNLQKRFKMADKRGNNKLAIDQFTQMLEGLSMLPQDVMSMHRITGFSYGRKTLSLQQFKTILQNRHKNRPLWQKKLVRKIKAIILQNGMSLDKFFQLVDKDGNGTIEASQLRKGLQYYNIFMNQSDWSNLFNLLDSDNSGEIDLNQLKQLMEQQKTGKLEELRPEKKKGNGDHQKKQEEEQVNQNQNRNLNQEENQQKQQGQQQENQKQSQNQNQNEKNQQNQHIQEQQKQQQNQKQQKGQPQQQKEEQFEEPYQQKDSKQDMMELNGKLKVQVPALKVKNHEKVYISFFVNEDVRSDDQIKLADLTKKKLEIASQIKFIKYKCLDIENLKLRVSIWATREMNQQNYLGQVIIDLKDVLQKPNQWAVKQKYDLNADEFQKQVQGKIYLQIKWTPDQQ